MAKHHGEHFTEVNEASLDNTSVSPNAIAALRSPGTVNMLFVWMKPMAIL